MDLFDKIKNYSQMKNESDIRNFETSVWSLAESKDPDILDFLIDLFYDDCEFPEVMYSLVHAIETYPNDIYVKKIISRIDKDIYRIPFWYYGLISAILNEPNCRDIFISHMNLAPKNLLLKLFDILDVETPHHHALLQELRKMLQD